MRLNKIQQKTLAIVFCLTLAAVAGLHVIDAGKAGKAAMQGVNSGSLSSAFKQFDETYNALFPNDGWINIYGLVNRVLGKREVANYQVVRDAEGFLYSGSVSWFEDETPGLDSDAIADSIASLSSYAEYEGARFLFVQCPYKTTDNAPDLANYVQPDRKHNYDEVLNMLKVANVDCLDLRGVENCRNWYRTDHHWTCDASFAAAREIVGCLASYQGFEVLDSAAEIFDSAVYERSTFPRSLLGSAGVKVGELYAGKDDFSWLAPTFETDIEYWHYKDGVEDGYYCGDFEQAFIDRALAGDADYKNKYNAFLHGGYVENVIANHKAPNSLKLLLVAHSYGRPMVQYLSLAFAETRYLDPQDARYTGSLVEYIGEYQPDIVVVMYDGVLNVD